MDEDGWITPGEAAGRLGVSEKTVRRRAKRGTLEARQVPTRFGPMWQVRPPTVSPPSNTGGVLEGAPPAAELVRWLRDLQEENRNLAGQVGYLQAQLQERDTRLLALTAGSTPETRTEDHQAASRAEVDSEHPRRPWWMVW